MLKLESHGFVLCCFERDSASFSCSRRTFADCNFVRQCGPRLEYASAEKILSFRHKANVSTCYAYICINIILFEKKIVMLVAWTRERHEAMALSLKLTLKKKVCLKTS